MFFTEQGVRERGAEAMSKDSHHSFHLKFFKYFWQSYVFRFTFFFSNKIDYPVSKVFSVSVQKKRIAKVKHAKQ